MDFAAEQPGKFAGLAEPYGGGFSSLFDSGGEFFCVECGDAFPSKRIWLATGSTSMGGGLR